MSPPSVIAALECQIGNSSVAFATDELAQLIEYEVASPAPLASEWLAGLGIHAGRALLSISLRPSSCRRLPRRRTTQGLCLKSMEGEAFGFAVEVTSARGLVEVVSTAPIRLVSGAHLPPWVKEATTLDGRRIGWVEVRAMINDLTGASHARP